MHDVMSLPQLRSACPACNSRSRHGLFSVHRLDHVCTVSAQPGASLNGATARQDLRLNRFFQLTCRISSLGVLCVLGPLGLEMLTYVFNMIPPRALLKEASLDVIRATEMP